MNTFMFEGRRQLPALCRRQLLSRLFCGVALPSLSVALGGCLATVPQQKEGRPFNTLRDYSREGHKVRIVNRNRFDAAFSPVVVTSPYDEPAGTVIINTKKRQLFLIEKGGKARRYGIAVGRAGYAWSGRAIIGRKKRWPAWHPTNEMRKSAPHIPRRIAPGEENPLGARALYLFKGGKDTLYRIHGTSEPWTIGTRASSGCIRMFNEDVIDLFDRVRLRAKVRVI